MDPVKETEAPLIIVSGAVSTKLGTAVKSLPVVVPVTAIDEVGDGVEEVALDLETLIWLMNEGIFDVNSVFVGVPPTSPRLTDFPVFAFPAPAG